MNSEFQVGIWLVQPSLNLISQNSTIVHLEPKVMQVLVCLAQRPGDLVSKEDVMRAVWADTFVTDDVLKRCISELRRVFEDDAREPRIIETIPKLGYRLLAPVEEVKLAVFPRTTQPREANHSAVATDLQPSPSDEQREAGLNRKRLLWSAAGLLVLAACVTVAYVRGEKSAVLLPPSFHRLTFERGIIYSARFAPDNQVLYDASWDTKSVRIFTTHAGILQPMPLALTSAHLLDISAAGELALNLGGYPEAYPVFLGGTLARTPMSGGTPRQLLEDVRWADWDRQGELAIVHHLKGKCRLEYPAGKVLYENAGWISNIRFSPRNDRIAFIDHPMWPEDRGSIVNLDLKGLEKKILSTGWESARGLAWSASGDEIWFTAAKSGERRDLFAVDLLGRQRRLLQIPGGITLHDISPDGRVLLTVDNERVGTMAISLAGERDLSWSDISLPRAVSTDGKAVLLNDQSEDAGPDYLVGLRSLDGSPPVRLGEGWGGDFSPDAKWTATTTASSDSTFLLPIGAGERRELKHPGVRNYGYPTWFMPDGQSLLFAGIESGHLSRMYIQSVEGGPARPITPEGILGRCPSPDGRYLVAQQRHQVYFLYDIQRSKWHDMPEATQHLWPIGWSQDSRYLYMYTRTGPPSQIWRLDVASGQEKLVKQLSPIDSAGILEIFDVQMTPDANTFIYGYDRYLSELYVVDNIH